MVFMQQSKSSLEQQYQSGVQQLMYGKAFSRQKDGTSSRII